MNRGGFSKRGPIQRNQANQGVGVGGGGGGGGGMNFNRGGRPQQMNNDRGGYNDNYGQGGRDFDRNRAGGGRPAGNFNGKRQKCLILYKVLRMNKFLSHRSRTESRKIR